MTKSQVPEIVQDKADELSPAVTLTRDEMILFEHVFTGKQQAEIAKDYGLSGARISQIIANLLHDEEVEKRLNKTWEKTYLTVSKKTALSLLQQVDPASHPEGKRVWDAGSLFVNTRLIEDKSTSNVMSLNVSLRARKALKKAGRDMSQEEGPTEEKEVIDV